MPTIFAKTLPDVSIELMIVVGLQFALSNLEYRWGLEPTLVHVGTFDFTSQAGGSVLAQSCLLNGKVWGKWGSVALLAVILEHVIMCVTTREESTLFPRAISGVAN